MDEAERRLQAVEKDVALMAEALKFRAAQDDRGDEYLERLRAEADREHERIRIEAEQRYRDHEARLRTLEKVAWTTLGTASIAVLISFLQLAVKAFQ